MTASRRRGAFSLSLSIVFIVVLACGTGLHLLDLKTTTPAHVRLSLHNTVTSSSSIPYRDTTNLDDNTATLASETIVNLVAQDDIMFEDYSNNNNENEDEDGDDNNGTTTSPTKQQKDIAGVEGPLLFFNISKPTIEDAILDKSSELSSFDGANTNCILQPVEKKVALMFLSDGTMPHEHLWETWLDSAAGFLPKSALSVGNAFCLQQCRGGECVKRCGRQTACNPLCKDALWRGYGGQRNGRREQHLFTLYTHPPPDHEYGKSSVFYGSEVAGRKDLKNSQSAHDQTEAAKLLIQEALKDPLNTWFVLLSSDTIPLYSPATMWQQLANDNQSKINACNNVYKNTMVYNKNSNNSHGRDDSDNNKNNKRWLPPLEMATSTFRPSDHWRSSSQWFMLNRNHADLVAQDKELAAAFKTYCSSNSSSAASKEGGGEGCVSYEHYVPSLLAMHGLEKETTCWWQGGTFTDWQTNIPTTIITNSNNDTSSSNETLLPKVILPGELTSDKINAMRNSNGSAECGGEVALSASQLAGESFIDVNLLDEQVCTEENGKVNRAKLPGKSNLYAKGALISQCNLLAWKADERVTNTLLSVYRDCESELGVLECQEELTSANKQWW